jgi:hypothetical protein
MPNVVFAYNSTESIPSAGAQRVTYNVAFADDSKSDVVGVDHELIDFSGKQDNVGVRKRLILKIGGGILKNSSDRAFFTAWFQAKHRWAVFGNFNDSANSGNQSLCKALLTDRTVQVSVDYDRQNGYELISENTF